MVRDGPPTVPESLGATAHRATLAPHPGVGVPATSETANASVVHLVDDIKAAGAPPGDAKLVVWTQTYPAARQRVRICTPPAAAFATRPARVDVQHRSLPTTTRARQHGKAITTPAFPDASPSHQDSLTINVNSGILIAFAGGTPGRAPATSVAFQVSRVPLSDIAAGKH